MRLKKDSPKLKATWLAIDIVLVILALAILGYCGYLVYQLNTMPDAALVEADIVTRQEQIANLESQLQDQTQAVEQAESESRAALNAAQTAKEEIQAQYDTVEPEHTALKTQYEEVATVITANDQIREDIARIRTEYGQAIRQLEDKILAGESDYRICYLTFDDGPSYLTPDFLDKIDKLDIYVTFFTIGVQMGESGKELREELLRREALAGHSIANHTYTHGIYSDLYDSLDIFMDAVHRQEELVYEVTGIRTDVLRFPAGSYYCPFRTSAIAALEEEGYGWIDWIGNAYDSGTPLWESRRVANNVIWQVSQDKVTVVLMHDWRSDTLGAIESIVPALKEQNYLFLPLFKESSLIGTASPKWDG